MVFFGQLVIGPPGSGKTTFCDGMRQMCYALHRKCAVINLDPANDELPYAGDEEKLSYDASLSTVDVRDLVSVEEIMQTHGLGPNGALIFAMEELLLNIDWLEEKLKPLINEGRYILFDCPGQVELFTHHTALLSIIKRLSKDMDARLTAVHLVDSVLCAESAKFISALLVSLSAQLQLELPHVNVLTKIDILKKQTESEKNPLAFRLEFYAEVQSLHHLLEAFDASVMTPAHPFDTKFRKLNEEICDLVESFNLVSFLLCDIENKELVYNILRNIDTANGFALSGCCNDMTSLAELRMMRPLVTSHEKVYGDIQEAYMDQ